MNRNLVKLVHRCSAILLITGFLLAAVGCPRGPSSVPPAEHPVVTVSHPVERDVTDYVYFTGRR